MTETTSTASLSRGPADHDVRDQILEAAEEHFSRYGYDKTTVSDLAKAIGFSKAYIYKFFDSKQAIGEAICSKRLSAMVATVEEAVAGASAPGDLAQRTMTLMRGRLVMAGGLQSHRAHDDRACPPGAPALPEPGL